MAATSLLIAFGTAVCFVALMRIDAAFGWLWPLREQVMPAGIARYRRRP